MAMHTPPSSQSSPPFARTKSLHSSQQGYNTAAVQSWTQGLSNHGSGRMNDPQDPAVQAYLQAKMALFQKAN